MSATTDLITCVYLDADPCPITTNLTVQQVAARVKDAIEHDCLTWVCLPTEDGDALVRPMTIVAIVPSGEDDDDD
jgi:uncharacterized protein YaiI (UPF0178 family)